MLNELENVGSYQMRQSTISTLRKYNYETQILIECPLSLFLSDYCSNAVIYKLDYIINQTLWVAAQVCV